MGLCEGVILIMWSWLLIWYFLMVLLLFRVCLEMFVLLILIGGVFVLLVEV